MTRRVELGCRGHFIGAPWCEWSRHTQVGNFRVSTVGNYYYSKDRTRQPLGSQPDSFFETMVFATSDDAPPDNDGCGCREVLDWSELDARRYATAAEAQCGHEELVNKYMTLQTFNEIVGDGTGVR